MKHRAVSSTGAAPVAKSPLVSLADSLRERGVRCHGCRHDRGSGRRDQGKHQSEENENLAHDRPPFPLYHFMPEGRLTICDPHHEMDETFLRIS